MCNIIVSFHCSRTNIESYGRRLLVRTLSGVLHTLSVVRPTYWNLASVGRSLRTHNGLSKFCSSVLELRKKYWGRHRGAEGTTVGDLPSPGNSSMLFMSMTTGFGKIGAICCGRHITASASPFVFLMWSVCSFFSNQFGYRLDRLNHCSHHHHSPHSDTIRYDR